MISACVPNVSWSFLSPLAPPLLSLFFLFSPCPLWPLFRLFSSPSSFCSFRSSLYLLSSSLPTLLQMLSALLHQQTCTKLLLVPVTVLRVGMSRWISSISCPAPRGGWVGFARPLPVPPTSTSWNTLHSSALAVLFSKDNWDFSQCYQIILRKTCCFLLTYSI